MTEHYHLHGMTVASQLPLPELAGQRLTRPAQSDVDVLIEPGPVPRELSGLQVSVEGFDVKAESVLLSVPGVARYLISGGKQITIDAARVAHAADVRVYLLGSAMAALLHQRGTFPL